MAYLLVEGCAESSISVVQSAVKVLKLLFFSAGLISTMVMVKEALVPFLCEIFSPNLVAFWNSFRYFISSPLYICIIINSVVLLIAVTSTFHHHDNDHDDDPPPPPPPPEATTLLSTSSDDEQCSTTSLYQGSATSDINNEVMKEAAESLSSDRDERESGGDDTITMDSTWKTIVEGKSKKLTKSESVPPRSQPVAATCKELRKLETFNDSASIRRLGGLRRDPSVDVEEFNKQVEAFINKFNRDMRLQRQESDQRFLDMINRS